MRKNILIAAVIVLAALAAAQVILPMVVGMNAASKLQEVTKAENVRVDVGAMPSFLLLAGKMDTLDIVVDKAQLNDIRVEKMTLHGTNVEADFSAMYTHDGSAIRSADSLELTGIITAEALQELLAKKLDKVENLKTSMDKDKISASGQVKLLGRMADISLEGRVLPKDGGLYFHMTKLDIRNAILGQAVLGNFFGDILIFDLYNSPIRAEITDVEQQDGQVVIKANKI